MLTARVRVDVTNPIGRIDPNIYGHFIEHLGRCINGGIWAEMLRARKFVGFDDDHNGLPDPWRPMGGRDPQLLAVVEDDDARRRCLRLRSLADDGRAHGVCYDDLSVRAGNVYSLHLQVRAFGNLQQVEIALAGERVVRPAPGGEWERWEIDLPAHWDCDDATLSIVCRGRGDLLVRAPSLMSARDRALGGYRAEVVELARAIKPPVVRWPGGCFADAYHWRDGVGERDLRPTVFDPAWQAWEPNDFGTDEFVAWCRLIGAEPYVCVNTGSADADEAAAWVEYCNGTADTPEGSRRAANGHPEPLGVRYWSVGNETYGSWEIGHVDAEQYARRFLEFARAMRAVDPNIKLIAVGADPNGYPDWNPTVLEIAGAEMNYLSVHFYCPHARDDERAESQYRAIVAAPAEVERRLGMVAQTIRDVLGPDSGVTIAFDEWNVWLDADRDNQLEERYELRDALFAGGIFHVLQRQCNHVTMANLAQLVNVLPAIRTSPTSAWGTPLYHAFSLYRHCESVAVACACDVDTFDVEAFGNIPRLEKVAYVDVTATVSEEGDRLVLAAVNRHRTEPVRIEIEMSGAGGIAKAEGEMLAGESERAAGSEHMPSAVNISSLPVATHEGDLVVELPPHSIGLIKTDFDGNN